MPDILKLLITRDLLPFFEPEEDSASLEGFALQVVEDGGQAWQVLEEVRPDLVMMDLNAEGMPGDDFCRRIHKHPQLRHIPVVLTVQSRHPEELNRCLKARCADILFKPLSKHLLMASARRILGLHYRSFARIPMCLEIRHGSGTEDMRKGLCVNLSSGGMFVETDQPLPAGQLLQVAFTLPGTTRSISSQACVAWINDRHNPVKKNLPSGMGLQFLSLGLADLLAICRYIRRRSDQTTSTDPPA